MKSQRYFVERGSSVRRTSASQASLGRAPSGSEGTFGISGRRVESAVSPPPAFPPGDWSSALSSGERKRKPKPTELSVRASWSTVPERRSRGRTASPVGISIRTRTLLNTSRISAIELKRCFGLRCSALSIAALRCAGRSGR